MIDHDEDTAAEIVGLVAFVIWTLACVGFGLLVGVVILGRA